RFATPIQATVTQVGSGGNIPAAPHGPGNSRPYGIDAEGHVVYDQTGAHPGRAYLAYVDSVEGLLSPTNTDSDIWVRYSDNNGVNWSNPVLVNDDQNLTSSQFHPHIAVDQSTGSVGVFWYDSRNDPNNVAVQPYVAVSMDG